MSNNSVINFIVIVTIFAFVYSFQSDEVRHRSITRILNTKVANISTNSDILVICDILVQWYFYNNTEACFNNIQEDFITKNRIYLDSEQHITLLNFTQFNVAGSISTSIGDLTHLIFILFDKNSLYGSIPTQFGRLQRLQGLFLETNALSGSIPTQLGMLGNLTSLFLSHNILSGKFPTEICKLSKLQYLTVRENLLTGSIPNAISLLTNIIEMSFSSNQFSGTFPSRLKTLKSLLTIDIGYNQLTGTISTHIGELRALEHLYFSSNQFSGTIPTQIGLLTLLNLLFLDFNSLSGTIPTELGRLTQLVNLILSDNKLTGTIPTELFLMGSSIVIYLSNNYLSGTIPTEIGQVSRLAGLLLNNNQLTGALPTELGIIPLFFVSLSSNKLNGTLPSELGQLSFILSYLLLDNNQFSGTIPTTFGNLKVLIYLYIPNNMLTGTIPTEIGNLLQLEFFYVYSNQLYGTIPTEIGKLRNLEYLYIDSNILHITRPQQLIDAASKLGIVLRQLNTSHFTQRSRNSITGTLPTELGKLKSLKSIAIDLNKVQGSIPTEFGLLSSLEQIYINNNNLDGNLPTELGLLHNLTEIRLNYNHLTHSIPSEWGNIENLKFLLISNNNIIGVIPITIGKLTLLNSLQLSNNYMTGKIPSQLGQLQRLEDLDISDNELFGTIPLELSNIYSLQTLYFNANDGLNGTLPFQICLLPNLTSLVLSNGVSCPITCQPKCSGNYANPTYITTNMPIIDPDQIATTNSLNSAELAGIVIGILLFLLIIIFSSRCLYIYFKSKPKTNEDIRLTMLLKQNNLKLYTWDELIINTSDKNSILGEGSFGLVIKAELYNRYSKSFIKTITANNNKKNTTTNKNNIETVAVKIMKSTNKIDAHDVKYDETFEQVWKEVQVHMDTEKKITNKNCIVKVYGIVEGQLTKDISHALNAQNAFGIIMRYEAGGSLSSVLYNKLNYNIPPLPKLLGTNITTVSNDSLKSAVSLSNILPMLPEFSLENKLNILHKIAQGLADLHEAGVIHGDLKSDNILLSSKDLSHTEIRLADFGFAEIKNKKNRLGESSLVETIHQRGTPVYSAPEQLQDPRISVPLGMFITYARPSEKTDMYSFGILTWEILTQLKPFANISSAVELSVKVHQGVRPDINLLPKDCPLAIRTMIERCWDMNRDNRLSALQCCFLLRECYEIFTTIKYDVYLSYKPLITMSHRENLIYYIRDQLIQNGLKVAWLHDVTISNSNNDDNSTNNNNNSTSTSTNLNNNNKNNSRNNNDTCILNENELMNARYDLINQSKIILLCLDIATQNDDSVALELGNNRGFKRPRPVIPLFLEPHQQNFPDNEIKVHCLMSHPDTKIFDISNLLDNFTYLDTNSNNSNDNNRSYNNNNNNNNDNNDEEKNISNIQIGIQPIDIELNNLIEHIHYHINSLCCI